MMGFSPISAKPISAPTTQTSTTPTPPAATTEYIIFARRKGRRG